MSLPGIVFYFVFGGNVLAQWGLAAGGEIAGGVANRSASAWLSVAAVPAGALAALANGLAFRYILTPLGLESLAPIVFVAFVLGYFAMLRAIAAVFAQKSYSTHDEAAFRAAVALYAVALSASGRFGAPAELLVAGAAAAFGYLAATVFLDAIVEKLELEEVPAPFRGLPARVLSAGLIALAFSGVEATFFAAFLR